VLVVDTEAPEPDDDRGVKCRWEVDVDDLLSMEEIESRYAPDWVLIGEPQTAEDLSVRAGRVLSHSPDRDEVYRKAGELRPGRFAVRFLGTRPENLALIL
jgi:hypothetical protein